MLNNMKRYLISTLFCTSTLLLFICTVYLTVMLRLIFFFHFKSLFYVNAFTYSIICKKHINEVGCLSKHLFLLLTLKCISVAGAAVPGSCDCHGVSAAAICITMHE